MKHITLTLTLCAAALLAACGKQESAAPVAEVAAPAAVVVAAAPDNAAGKSVFNRTCAMCHSPGTAGAPKPGDKADWGPRIAQGADTLYKHAIDGFTGAKGPMPRGGAATLSDADVKAAVNYMVDASR